MNAMVYCGSLTTEDTMAFLSPRELLVQRAWDEATKHGYAERLLAMDTSETAMSMMLTFPYIHEEFHSNVVDLYKILLFIKTQRLN